VLLGDYVDRGPDTKKVVDFLIGKARSGRGIASSAFAAITRK
jgi:hypothetical protein